MLALARARAARAPPFVSFTFLARADVPGAGGISIKCLVNFRIAARVLCMTPQLE